MPALSLTVSLALMAFAAGCSDDATPTADAPRELSDDRDDDDDATDDGNDRSSGESDDDRPDETSDDGSRTGGDAESEFAGGAGRFLRLVPFPDCSAFLDHIKAEAAARVGPYGLDGSGMPWAVFDAVAVEESAAASDEALAAPASAESTRTSASGTFESAEASGGPTVTGTNVQELGIDEPDIVKTDGTRILTVSENLFSYVDVSGEQPVVTDQLTLSQGWAHQMFLAGDRVLLITNAGGFGGPMPVDIASVDATVGVPATIAPEAFAGMPAAEIIEIDLSNPAELRIASTLRIEGQYLSARLIGTRMLLVLSSGPQWMPWLYPQTEAGAERARLANQEMIDGTQLADWTPQYELAIDGNVVSSGDLLGCDRLRHPAEFAGFDVVSVVDVDLTGGLAGFDPALAVGVLAGGQTVYASLDRLYVATTRWIPIEMTAETDIAVWSEDYRTELHAFSITPGSPIEYVASGAVEGTLLNQFSLDEHQGYLRVIGTDGSPWNQSDLSETRLVVLQEQGEQLVAVGQVGGLGQGEQLYSARLIGDRGYAVTFRQVDPFYVLDLSDPTNPRVTGELKIPGFSNYLHPVGEHRVLGIGQDATEEGRTTGLKLSLFDVADPANPVELSTWTLAATTSPAEYDHHAFQMVGSTAILPVQSYSGDVNAAIVFEIGDTIVERGSITHADPLAEPTTDCRPLSADDLPAASELAWLASDPYTHAQLCTIDQAGGYGTWYCEPVPVDQLDDWYGVSPAAVDDVLAVSPDVDRLELCYPNGFDYLSAIQRSVAIDDTLWTVSARKLQAHDLGSLTLLAEAPLR